MNELTDNFWAGVLDMSSLTAMIAKLCSLNKFYLLPPIAMKTLTTSQLSLLKLPPKKTTLLCLEQVDYLTENQKEYLSDEIKKSLQSSITHCPTPAYPSAYPIIPSHHSSSSSGGSSHSSSSSSHSSSASSHSSSSGSSTSHSHSSSSGSSHSSSSGSSHSSSSGSSHSSSSGSSHSSSSGSSSSISSSSSHSHSHTGHHFHMSVILVCCVGMIGLLGILLMIRFYSHKEESVVLGDDPTTNNPTPYNRLDNV
eukprot:TRINITY_DN2508_c0_g1_i1.p1 TRINITY_DN2508_c0_g1~~TRINITY_DN2508_c0_g1_i1.p1  ORF type:complete len:253 (+),score=69.38 TRINITY_DN2508_c0_g1_i1:179-937(+)